VHAIGAIADTLHYEDNMLANSASPRAVTWWTVAGAAFFWTFCFLLIFRTGTTLERVMFATIAAVLFEVVVFAIMRRQRRKANPFL
jgi:hypothetical protein